MKIKSYSIRRPSPIGFSLALLPLLLGDGAAFGGNQGANTLTPLTNAVVCPGDSAAFSTVASGPTPYHFEWWKNGVVIPGQTNNSLVFLNVSATNVATYSVKLTGAANSVTNSATLTLRTNVSATPLSDLVRFVGATAIFSTTASGTGPFTYMWAMNSAIMSGQTANSLTLTNLSTSDSGTYSVIVSSACKSVTNSANLMVDTCFPAVDVMLVIDRSGSMLGQKYTDARQACSNFVQNLHFSTNADQAGLASYNTSATLDAKLTNNMQVLNQAIASLPGAAGNTSISSGLLTGQGELTSTRHHPQALPVIVLLSDGLPTAETKSNVLYNATQVKNAGTRVFTVGLGTDADPALLAGVASSPGDFYFTTNSSQLTALFNAISTVICRPPTNIIGPSNLTVCAGATATFSVSASGCAAFSYQWDKDGVRIPGQTSSTLVLSNVSVNAHGLYAVEVTSACRNVTNSATLTVTPPPTINCSANKTVEFGAPWSFDAPMANYLVVVTGTVTNTAGHCGNTFDATRTWQTTDTCGNSAQCSQKVTVSDTTAPTMNCAGSANKTVQLGAAWNFDAPTATDISGPVTITILSTVTNTAGHCGNTFAATRIWQAADVCGNTSTCSQMVTVIDTTAPTMNCTASANKTVELGSPWSFDAPTATDIGGGTVTITILSTVTNTTSHCGNTFAATRIWQAADACGNNATCSQTVTVIDTTAPTMNCTASANKTVELGSPWSFDAPTATDIGGGTVTITILSTLTNTTSHCGNSFAATRTWQAADACGNHATCSQTVNVIDTTAPTMNCTASANKTVELGSPWSFDAPTATDIGGGTVTITILSTVTNITGHCGNTFDATRTWQATDACGNNATCSQTVNVIDTTAPTMNCTASANKTVELGSPWSFDAPTATDIGGGTVTITILNTVTNITGHCGNTFDATQTWQATDACGNTSTCSQTVTVVDTTAPTMNCTASANKTVESGSIWSFDAPTATDIGGGDVTITILTTVTNTTGHCGNTFDATRTWQATDACGNTSTCSQKVNVIDTTAPTVSITSPTNGTTFLAPARFPIIADAHDTNGTITLVEFFSGTDKVGQSASGPPYLIVLTNVPAGSYTLIARATDSCGNMATSAPVHITVLASLPLTVNGPIKLNFQTGFYEQIARVFNPTPFTLSAVGVLAYNMPTAWRLQNASFTNGVPGVLYNQPLASGASTNVTLKYFLGPGASTNASPTLVAIEMSPGGIASAVGTPVRIIRQLVLADGSFLINFATVSGATYFVLYSDDMVTWKTSAAPVYGTGFTAQWIDYGPPATDSLPSTHSARFYRVVSVP